MIEVSMVFFLLFKKVLLRRAIDYVSQFLSLINYTFRIMTFRE